MFKCFHCYSASLSARWEDGMIRRIYTEENTKVVAAVWGTEFITVNSLPRQFFFSGRFEEQDEFLSSYHSDAINPFLHIILVQNRQRGKEMNKFCPPNSSDDLCLLLCINPSSLDIACYVWPVQKHHIFVYDIKNFIFLMQHVF